MPTYYNQAGQPISLEAWAIAHEDFEALKVRFTELSVSGEKVIVSTVWIGIDLGLMESEYPLIFETMVFGGKHDQEQIRSPTRDAAIAAHGEMVQEIIKEGKNASPNQET